VPIESCDPRCAIAFSENMIHGTFVLCCSWYWNATCNKLPTLIPWCSKKSKFSIVLLCAVTFLPNWRYYPKLEYASPKAMLLNSFLQMFLMRRENNLHPPLAIMRLFSIKNIYILWSHTPPGIEGSPLYHTPLGTLPLFEKCCPKFNQKQIKCISHLIGNKAVSIYN